MQKRPLGNSGLMVTPIALGTWAMGGAIESWGEVDDRESIAAIHQALDLGLNLIDTAPIYGLGHSEEIVGNAIHNRREDVILATKCGLLFPKNENETPARCLHPESVIAECEASLRRLRTDVIDLYYCHWADPATPIRETMEALRMLMDQGKIRAIGLSNFSCDEISAAREYAPVHAIQPSFSMLHLRAAEDLLPFCVEHSMGIFPYSPLAKGLLAGKFGPETTFTGIRARDPDFIGERYLKNLQIIEALRPIAEKYGKTLAQLVINWTAGCPGVTAPIVGARRPSQVTEIVGGIGWTLFADDRNQIDRIVRGDAA